MTRLLVSKGRHAGEPVAEDTFARRKGRHCRRLFASHGTSTGWSALGKAVNGDDGISRRRSAGLAILPLADPFPSLPEHRHPYDSQRGAA